MTKAILKAEKTREKLEELKAQYKDSLEKRNKDLVEIMAEMGLSHVNGYTLVGALLEIKDNSQNQNEVCEVWKKAGQNYLRRTKRRSL